MLVLVIFMQYTCHVVSRKQTKNPCGLISKVFSNHCSLHEKGFSSVRHLIGFNMGPFRVILKSCWILHVWHISHSLSFHCIFCCFCLTPEFKISPVAYIWMLCRTCQTINRALYRGVCHTKILDFRPPLYPIIAIQYTKYRFHFTIY